tara:strand:- start:749 stop:1321 length:573 start_codon:yes stop_codon:yes gene_type:complete
MASSFVTKVRVAPVGALAKQLQMVAVDLSAGPDELVAKAASKLCVSVPDSERVRMFLENGVLLDDVATLAAGDLVYFAFRGESWRPSAEPLLKGNAEEFVDVLMDDETTRAAELQRLTAHLATLNSRAPLGPDSSLFAAPVQPAAVVHATRQALLEDLQQRDQGENRDRHGGLASRPCPWHASRPLARFV